MAEGGGGPGAPTPDHAPWDRVSAVLDQALELPPGERRAVLDAACAGDPTLRAEVERLLHACDRSGEFLDGSAAAFAAGLLAGADPGEGDDPELGEGALVGPYRVVREVARGGMGAVYLAERDDPQLRQRVAIKRMRRGLGSDYMIQRFLEERQILASLEHPGIARLLDGAVSEDGLPWFAMEYVEGVPIDGYCDERRLTVEERLALFCRVCDAVHFAHRSLLVHQDLKPSNILVTPAGDPKLLDFGIARMASAQPAGAAEPAAGEPLRLMTPEYASPEQLRGEPVTTATDVYSLGVLLHRLLTGHRPPRRSGHPSEVGPPPLPASPADTFAERCRTTPERLRRRLSGDLDAITRKATMPEPGSRYATAAELATDLRRHLHGLPVHARPDTRGYRLRRFVTRNRVGVTSAAVAAGLLVALAGFSAVQARRAAVERDRAQEVEGFVLGLLYRSDAYQGSGRGATVRELLDQGAAELGRGSVRQPLVRSRLFYALGRAYYSHGAYPEAIAFLDSAYTLVRRQRGDQHPEAVAIANQLADVLRFAGRYDAARDLYGVILDARRREFGDSSTEVARSLNGLAMVLRMQGDYAGAERLLRHALDVDRRQAALEPAALTQTLNNLGHVLREQERLEEAEALHRQSLAARRALWGPEHFEVSVSLANLAAVLSDRSDFDSADSVYREAMRLRLRLVGEEHPDLATDRAGFALLLHRQGELGAAEPVYRQALAVQRRALAEGHLVTAATLVGLGLLLVDLGRPAEAEPLLREALGSRERMLPTQHWQVAEARSALGACLSALGRTQEAEPMLVAALATLGARRDPAGIHRQAAVHRLVGHYERAGRRAEANLLRHAPPAP